ncbi:MAG TPA: NADH-quinone oxidoreductase subunit NuoF [Candidatus Rifleibacterium sp.]|jgi:NADH:ubiquinone oxidoreductase subunit F (NADH-binding)/(2Fe-2S) ferredoxin|nr:NADH-quinone oxidoreductase subunit NuoF [Candidatus Rifleibacterium sp.]
MIDSPAKLKSHAENLSKNSKPATTILVSLGTCGIAAGTRPINDMLKAEIASRKADIEIVEVGCMGLCHSEPTIEVVNNASGKSVIYGKVKADQVAAIIETASKGIEAASCTVINRSWFYPEENETATPERIQARIVLKNTGKINPEILDHYLAEKGYQALSKVLFDMTPQQVIDTVIESGLRGRGGGGFPTGKKWAFAAAQKADQKYVLCNADEGDPGAFMDRAVLEGDPHSVLEAMAITGYAIGSDTGIIYIRAEYPLAVKRLEIAIDQAKKQGLLGKNILGSKFSFDIMIKYGAGAFVCGEETALIHSVEGKRGEPTVKPPFPAIEGLWKKPTVVNNVETFANVCAIIRNGAPWFKKIGTPGSPGTKVFALAGKVKKVGLVEVPMGTTLRQIIFNVGGGIMNDRKFKAVQTGGPSGGCIKFDQLDTEIDYESLKRLGSMMGSGGMIVMDEDDCMVNVAKFFLEFTLDESCGKCTPCRIGNKRLYEMLHRICDGRGTRETIQNLKDLSNSIKDTALCGLGQTSPNPVLSTLAQFEHEYLAHIDEKRCEAGVCKKLLKYEINNSCVGCTLCARNCPANCISGSVKQKHSIDQSRCIKCGVCMDVCKFHAVDRK